MSKSFITTVYAGALTLGLVAMSVHPGFAQGRPGSGGHSGASAGSMGNGAGVGNTQGRQNGAVGNATAPNGTTGYDRAQDRMSQPGLNNSNGIGATDRATGLDRAASRMSQQGLDNNNAGDAKSRVAQGRIEADGYKNVQGLAKGSDGLWHGSATRGTTKVPVTVDARGNVVAN